MVESCNAEKEKLFKALTSGKQQSTELVKATAASNHTMPLSCMLAPCVLSRAGTNPPTLGKPKTDGLKKPSRPWKAS